MDCLSTGPLVLLGGNGDADDAAGSGIVEAVIDQLFHAGLVGAGIGAGLTRRLIRANARGLVDLGASVPEQDQVGDVAVNDGAVVVPQGDARLIRCVE